MATSQRDQVSSQQRDQQSSQLRDQQQQQHWWAQPEPPGGSSSSTTDADWVAVGIEDIEVKQGSDILINRIPEYIKHVSGDSSRADFEPKELRVGLYTNKRLDAAAGGLDVFKLLLQRAVARGPGASPPPSPSAALTDTVTDATAQRRWLRFCKRLEPDLERAAAAYELSTSRPQQRTRAVVEPSPQAPSLLLALDAIFICAFLRSSVEWQCWGYPFRHIFQDSRFEARRFPLYRDLMVVENQVPMFLLTAVVRYFIKPDADASPPAGVRSAASSDDDEEEEGKLTAAVHETVNSLLMTAVVAVYPFNHGLKLDAGTEDLEKHLGKHFAPRSPDALWRCDHVLAATYLAICGGLNPRPPEDDDTDTEEEERQQARQGGTTGGGGNGIRALGRRLPFLTSLTRRTSTGTNGAATPNSTTSEPLLLNGHANGHGPAAAASFTSSSSSTSRTRLRVPSATFLRATYGITFQVSRDSLTLPGIRYSKRTRTLHLPTLIINDHTVSLFRNLALYEQLQVPAAYRADLRTYLYLITCLVDDVHDVRLLAKHGVLVNQLGSDKAVAQQWNTMSHGLFIPSNPPHYWGSLQRSIAQLERAGHSQSWFLGDLRTRVRQRDDPLIPFAVLALVLITVSSVVQAVVAVLTFRRNPIL